MPTNQNRKPNTCQAKNAKGKPAAPATRKKTKGEAKKHRNRCRAIANGTYLR